MSFKSVSSCKVTGNSDDVTLTFRCRGNLDTNYDGFLSDAAEAVVQLKANYESSTPAGKSAHVNSIRQRVIHALEAVFDGGR